MTFPAELERLRDATLAGKSSWYDMDQFFRNHADAILGLVRAADDALLALNMGLGLAEADYDSAVKQAIKARDAVTQAFAKLNGAEK